MDPKQTGQREKRLVALSSVLAAVLLTGTKLAVGLMTGSLGILAEAAHSGLDLAAALLTLFAVRFSGRAADADHPYGHGKVENLSALFETQLLLVTCGWILYEAIHRLIADDPVEIDANVWAFLVVLLSIVVDISRSRALFRVARKYGSQALEADALHFSTDIWSSAVVFVGLAGVVAARAWSVPWLVHADAVAALAVAVFSIGICIRLGRRTIADLMDAVPPGLRDQIAEAVLRVSGVVEIRTVRVRRSGPEFFTDLTLTSDPAASLERAHEITHQVEEAVGAVLPGADVVVHAEPADTSGDLGALVRREAARQGLAIHDLRVVDEADGRQSVDLHIEVNPSLTVGEAHAQAERLEQAVREAFHAVARITTHLEPAGEAAARTPELPQDADRIRAALAEAAREVGLRVPAHDIEVRRESGALAVTFHCHLDATEKIETAHARTMQLERALRARVPDVARVTIHVEPPE
jgi:cation diffusion facilitator family transporter